VPWHGLEPLCCAGIGPANHTALLDWAVSTAGADNCQQPLPAMHVACQQSRCGHEPRKDQWWLAASSSQEASTSTLDDLMAGPLCICGVLPGPLAHLPGSILGLPSISGTHSSLNKLAKLLGFGKPDCGEVFTDSWL